MYRKHFAWAVMLVGLSLAVTACGQGGTQGQASAPPNQSNASASVGQKVTLKIGDTEAATDIVNVMLQQFAKDVAQKTKGTVNVQVFPSGQLGGELEMVQQVGSGNLQAVVTGATGDQAMDGFYAPFAFKSQEQMDKALQSGIFDPIFQKFEQTHHAKYLGTLARSPREITSNVRFSTPDGLKNLKIRVPQIKPLIGGFKYAGADAAPLAFPEVFQALQTGVVKAQENPVELIYNSKFYEVQKYLILTDHVYAPFFVFVNDTFWNSLTSDQQRAITESFAAVSKQEEQQVAADRQKFIDQLKAKGMTVIEPDKAAFRNVIYEGYTKAYLETVWGKDIVAKLAQTQ